MLGVGAIVDILAGVVLAAPAENLEMADPPRERPGQEGL